jgi:hypothetical protein
MRAVVLASLAVLVLGCSATNAGSAFGGQNEGNGSGGAGAGGSGAGGLLGGGGNLPTGAGGAAPGSDCAVATQLIYVLSEENDLYSFDPLAKVFKKIGPLACPTSMQPNSMAIDRHATAWVNYVQSDGLGNDTAGSIFEVSTADASCHPTNVALPSGFYRLGMGFSVDAPGAKTETLYVTGTSGGLGQSSPGLGKIDLASMALTPVGAFTGPLAGQNAELTGTGDARLFGFFTTQPINVAEIDKASGAIKSATPLPAVEVPVAWAFSFWGGDFYLYTAPNPNTDPGRTSNVTHYRPSDGSVDTTYMTNVGFRIVGAGVSTCAPIVQPK